MLQSCSLARSLTAAPAPPLRPARSRIQWNLVNSSEVIFNGDARLVRTYFIVAL